MLIIIHILLVILPIIIVISLIMLISTYNITDSIYIIYNSSILIQYTSLKTSQMVIIDSFSIGYYICILIMVRFVLGRSILIRSFMRRSKNRANPRL